ILEIRKCIPVVKIIARLELDETISFPDRHYLFSYKGKDYVMQRQVSMDLIATFIISSGFGHINIDS
ncbi:MAG: hypothetical protein COZ70_01075, partial [Deltaproteobacteria bacterium CG_4_8_14_3_um_filter_51_11]